MARRKAARNFDPISLAFLDVMSCGFGAAILLFLIIDHRIAESTTVSPQLNNEIAMLDVDIREEQDRVVEVRSHLEQATQDLQQSQGEVDRVQRELMTLLAQLADTEGDSLAREESLERLRADVRALEEELRRLQGTAEQERGNSSREFLGEGDRQYLTGMFLGGNRILILLDTSASMLDDTLVNIIRTRNMSDEVKRAAPKWTRAVRIVEWISSQMPVASQYQLMSYNEGVSPVLPGTDELWLEVADQDELNEAIRQVRTIVPAGGNNLEAAFRAIANMSPRPDNVYLITDGLPTQGSRAPAGNTISSRDRLRLFSEALQQMPRNIPVNTILLPMEGDPGAAAAYWQLGVLSGGSFITPSSDWP